MGDTKGLVCPYCGKVQPTALLCSACGVRFDGSTRASTLERMGPWFVRDENHAFMPGCSWEQLADLVARGVVTRASVIRGPTTRQLWTMARKVQGVAHLLGCCHACSRSVNPHAPHCPACKATFAAPLDRNHMGIPESQAEASGSSVLGAAAGSSVSGAVSVGATPKQRRAAERHRAVTGSLGGAISAFASDEELREGLIEETHRRRSLRSATHHHAPAPGPAVAVHSPTSPGGEPGSIHPGAQRWVIPIVVAIVVFTVVLGVVLILATKGSSPAPAGGTPAASSPSSTPAPAPAPPPPRTAKPAAAPASPSPSPSPPPSSTTSAPVPSAAAPALADPPAVSAEEADLQAAEAHVKAAQDGSRSIQERRTELNQCTEELQRLLARVNTSQLADRVRRLQSTVANELRRLNSEEFVKGAGKP